MYELDDFAECGVGGELLFPGTLVISHHGDLVCGEHAHRLHYAVPVLYT